MACLALGLLAWGLLARTIDTAPDAHYTEALKVLARYEDATHLKSRNYAHPVYEKALELLALVDPESVSGEDSRLLEEDLKRRVAANHARKEAIRLEQERSEESKRYRKEAAQFARDVQQAEMERRSRAEAKNPEDCIEDQ